jgi:hypothetical protein
MNKLIFISCTFFILLTGHFTTLSQDLVPLTSQDLGGILVSRTDTYDQEFLKEYNPGDAPLLMEYGFRSLLVQEFQPPNGTTRLEIFRMGSPEEAFGIYSVSAIGCLLRDTLTRFDCFGSSRYMAAYGDLYIIISIQTDASLDPAFATLLAGQAMLKNPRSPLQVPIPFDTPRLKESRQNLMFMKGQLGLENSMYPVTDLFLGIHFGMFATKVANTDFDLYFTRIWFPDPTRMMAFLTRAGLTSNNIPIPNTDPNGLIYREYRPIDDHTIYFLQSRKPYPISAFFTK